MDTLSLTDLQEFIHHDGELFSGWVYVSSLAMRSYKKSPLLRRYCRVRLDEDRPKMYLEFFINQDDFEPTRRISLSRARLVISRGAKLTKAQFARIDRDLGPSSPSVYSDPHVSAFYIDFPKKIDDTQVAVSRDNTIYETRSVRFANNGSGQNGDDENDDDFPLGFIMVCPSTIEAAQLEAALSQGCHVTIPRERKRMKVQRWMNRAWMKLRGELSIDQFDEATKGVDSVPGSSHNGTNEVFFTIAPPRKGVVPRIESLESSSLNDTLIDDDASDTSFITAGEAGGEAQDDDDAIDRIALGQFKSTLSLDDPNIPNREFACIEEMLGEKSERVRHSTRISKSEILSVIDYIEKTRIFSTSSPDPGWSLCSEGENFDCFKSIDESTGIVRTRTWAKLPKVPPQTLFHILYNTDARKSWDHHYERFLSEWTDPADPELDIIDAVVTAPFGCANREFLEWRRRLVPTRNSEKQEKDGTFVIYLRSYDDVSREGGRPVGKTNVRAEVWLSGYVIQWWKDEMGNRLGSQVLVMTQIDVKGLIPKYLVNALSSSGPKRWVKSVSNAAISEIQNIRQMTLDDVFKLEDSQLDKIYNIHQ